MASLEKIKTGRRKFFPNALIYGILGLIALTVLVPFIWAFLASFKPESEIVAYPPQILSHTWTFEQYKRITKEIPFLRVFSNTVGFACTVVICQLVFDSATAYALTKVRVPGRRLILLVILGTMMVPPQITLVPLYIMLSKMNWLDTLQGLVVPRATSAFGIFLLVQFFRSIPDDFVDAARIDGASEFQVLFKIMLPMAKPALATIAIISFMANWNDFLWPLMVIQDFSNMTLPVALALFRGQHNIQYGLAMAGSVISITPVLVLFLFAQRYFVEGTVMSGLKG
jgi:multiple sugar transport system permease protein